MNDYMTANTHMDMIDIARYFVSKADSISRDRAIFWIKMAADYTMAHNRGENVYGATVRKSDFGTFRVTMPCDQVQVLLGPDEFRKMECEVTTHMFDAEWFNETAK